MAGRGSAPVHVVASGSAPVHLLVKGSAPARRPRARTLVRAVVPSPKRSFGESLHAHRPQISFAFFAHPDGFGGSLSLPHN